MSNVLSNGRHVLFSGEDKMEYDVKNDQIVKTYKDGKLVKNPENSEIVVSQIVDYNLEKERNDAEIKEQEERIKEKEKEKEDKRHLKKVAQAQQKLDKRLNKWEKDNELKDGEYRINLDDGTENVFCVANGQVVDSYIQDHEGTQKEYFTQNELSSEKLQKNLTEIIKNHEYKLHDGTHELERSDGSNNIIKVENGRVVGVTVKEGNQSKQLFTKDELADPSLQYEFKRIMRLSEEREQKRQIKREVKPHDIQKEMDISL